MDVKWLPQLRPATKQDAVQLAVLMDIASHGLVSWYWSTLVSVGQSPLEIGRDRLQGRHDLSSHFSHWTIAEIEGEIVGAFAGYVIPNPYNPGDVKDLPKVYAPILELESLAAGYWYLMSLSVYPEFRRKGIGSSLLQAAILQAKGYPVNHMTLTVSSANKEALALYSQIGFNEMARRNYVAFPGSREVGEWILLSKELNS